MSQIKSLRTGIKFKDTPIGKIPVDWEGGTFSKIADINPKRNLKKGAIYPFVEMAAISSESPKIQYSKLRMFNGSGTKFKNGDTLFARITPCTENGKTAYVDFLKEDKFGHGSTEFIVLGPLENNDPKFIFYCAKWDKVRNVAISKMEGTSGRQRVPNRVFSEDIFVPIPPHPEQKKIAEILMTVDDGIEETDRIIEKTKELKKGLMQRLLTRGIGHEKFKKTEIGKIPEEWEVGKISDYGEIVTGSTPSTLVKEYYGNDFPFVSPFDLGKVKVIIKTEKHLSKEGASVARMLPANTVLFVCIGSTIGKTGVAGVQLATNQQINAIICEGSDFNFVYYYLSFISDKIKQIAGTQAVPIVNKSLFSNVVVVIPKLDEQQEIGNILSSVDSEIEDGENHNRNLETLKKSLMQILLTGKVRVKLH